MDDLVVPGAGTPPRRGWCPGSGDGGGVENPWAFLWWLNGSEQLKPG